MYAREASPKARASPPNRRPRRGGGAGGPASRESVREHLRAPGPQGEHACLEPVVERDEIRDEVRCEQGGRPFHRLEFEARDRGHGLSVVVVDEIGEAARFRTGAARVSMAECLCSERSAVW